MADNLGDKKGLTVPAALVFCPGGVEIFFRASGEKNSEIGSGF